MRFSRGGGARFISHLDTARALQRTFARAGVGVALSAGLRPKPRMYLGLPLPVGVEARDELAAVEVVGDVRDPQRVLGLLREAAPEGLEPFAVEVCEGRPHLDPVRAVYECLVSLPVEEVRRSVRAFATAPSVEVERVSPKGRRKVDLKRFVEMEAVREGQAGTWVRFAIRHRREGAARPEEVLGYLTGESDGSGVRRAVRQFVEYTGGLAEASSRESE